MAGPWEEYQGQEDGPWAEYAGPVQTMPTVEVRPDPTEGMSGTERFGAGVGKSLVDTAYGLAQSALMPRIPEFINRAADSVDEAIGSPLYSDLRKKVTGAYNAPRAALERDIADRREIDRPLMNTGAGLAGNVTGSIAQMLGPGFLARGTAASSAILPTTLRGNLLQGVAMGAAQPSLSDTERLGNAALGGGGGLLGAAIPAAAGASLRSAKGLLAPFTESGAANQAAKVVQGFAEDPARLLVRQPSSIPGVRRTLAEETLDPGVAQLQRTVAAKEGAAFDSMRRSNNAARVGAIRGFAGDEADIAAAEAARDASAIPLLNQAEGVTGIDSAPVLSLLDDAIKSNASRPSVSSALKDVRGALGQAGDDLPSLYNARKYIDDLMQGRVGSEQGYARAATRELQQVKSALDTQLEAASPEFGSYLDLYRSGSAPINRMQAGQELLKRGSGGIADPSTGLEVLTPAKFGQQVRNLDQVAASATGFGKATAKKVFEPSDLSTIGGVNDDLSRQAFADNAARGSGSDTFQKLMTNGDILGAVQEMGVNIPGAGIIRMLGKGGKERVNQQLIAILTDPARAQDVLKQASASDRKVIQGVLQATGGRLGIESGQQASQWASQ